MQYQIYKGRKLGNYIIDDRLGKGGFANVYLASHIHFGEKVAIKVLNERGFQEDEREEFLEEAKKLRGLNHPNIIKIWDFGVEIDPQHPESSMPYLVMDYAPMGTLRSFCPRNTRMPLAVVVQYVRQIASALQCAHDHHPLIVHRDVKPENVLLMSREHVVLSDFGIAVSGMSTQNLQYQKDQLAERQARKEQILFRGTPAYVAPEYWLGHTQRASDQYALAVMAYEWLCGYQPFSGTPEEISQHHALTQPPSFWQKFSDIPQEVELVVMRALEKRPEDRYKTVMDFSVALEKAAAQALQPSMVYRSVQGPAGQPPGATAPTVYPGVNSLPPTQPAGPVPQQSQQGQPQMKSAQMQMVQPPIWLGQPPGSQVPPAWQQPNPMAFAPRSQTIPGPAPNRGQTSKLGGLNTFMDDVRGSLKAARKPIQRVLKTDDYFLRTYRNRRFFFQDLLANLLLTLPVLFSKGPWLWLVGMLVSYCLIWYCTLALKKLVAILCGVGVALWWGYAVWSLISIRFPLSTVPLWSFLIFLLLGLASHTWYVLNRIKE